jgi:hypothetical protein
MRLPASAVTFPLLLSLAAPLSAQAINGSAASRDTAVTSAAPAPADTSTGARKATDLRVAAHYAATPRSTVVASPNRAGLGQARAMMIVGAGALIAGAIIGDTVGTLFMVGGAIIGLLGLYEYLQ